MSGAVIEGLITLAPSIIAIVEDAQAAIAAGAQPTAAQQAALDLKLAADQLQFQAAAALALSQQPAEAPPSPLA